MRTLRRSIKLKDGVEVDALFTPHLFSFKEEFGLAIEADTNNLMEVLEAYADIYFLAAVNAWVLDGKGQAADFPYTRGDFHEYMAANPKPFAKDVDFAVQALTGKTAKELVDGKKKRENSATSEAPEGKKKVFRWIGRLLRRRPLRPDRGASRHDELARVPAQAKGQRGAGAGALVPGKMDDVARDAPVPEH